MTVEVHSATDRVAWLQLRRRDVTASVAGCLLGADVHEYITPFELWALKSGRLVEDPEETPAMRRGRLLEPVALELLAEQRPDWRIVRPGVYLRDPEARIGATPDAFAWERGDGPAEERVKGIVQVKSVNPQTFRAKWKQEDGSVEPPLWIVVQAIIEAKLASAAWAVVAALVVGHGLDLHVVEVPLHEGVYARLVDEVARFWKLVDSGEMPPVDYGRDADAIRALYPVDNGSHIDLTGDNRFAEVARERTILSRRIKADEKALKEANAELLYRVGSAISAEFAGGTLTAKTIHRRAYTVEAGSYRALRIKLDNPPENADE